MFFEEIAFESAEEDRKAIKIANYVWRILKTYTLRDKRINDTTDQTRSNKQEIKDQKLTWRHSLVKFPDGGVYPTTYVFLRDIKKIPQKFSDLMIVYSEKPEKWGGHFYQKFLYTNTSAIVIYVKDSKTMIKNLEDTQEIFLHEFIHYLDYKRFKQFGNKPGKDFTRHPEDSSQYWRDYYNTPHEFNAYYQQFVMSFLSNVERRLGFRDNIPKMSTKQFITYVWNNFTNNKFKEHISDKYRKKFFKRLVKLHQDISERVIDHQRQDDPDDYKVFDKTWVSNHFNDLRKANFNL